MDASEAIEYLERYSYDTETMMEVIEVLRAETELLANLRAELCPQCFTTLHLLTARGDNNERTEHG
jgi:2-polyprenyl-3-methyl-5-hydroxy-6-metoxy-1,4-benzoquinol methylase